jgi:hypothetical protein
MRLAFREEVEEHNREDKHHSEGEHNNRITVFVTRENVGTRIDRVTGTTRHSGEGGGGVVGWRWRFERG